ncbi:hypothetical protein [Nitrospira calida]|jgi:hypothetical protein
MSGERSDPGLSWKAAAMELSLIWLAPLSVLAVAVAWDLHWLVGAFLAVAFARSCAC